MNGLRHTSRLTTTAMTLVAIVCTLMMTGLFRGSVPHAYAASGSYNVTKGASKLAAQVNVSKMPTGKVPLSSQHTHVVPRLSPHAKGFASRAGMVKAANTPFSGSHSLVANFNGVSSVDSMNVNGLDVEPPDQGLCVGNGFVMEPVNLALTIYHPDGSVIAGPVSLPTFFGEPPAFDPAFGTDVQGDPRCYYDAATNTWFVSQLFLTLTGTLVSHFDLAVNTSGDPTTTWTIYRFDTTDSANPGCPCLGDQPLFGIDSQNVYISTNEFSIAGPNFNGAQVYAISKSQLEAGTSTVNFVHFGNLNVGGAIAASVQPAITTGHPGAEYFMDSLDPNGTFDNRIGVWAMTSTDLVTSGGVPNLSNVVVTSEAYGLPPNAESPGGVALQTDDDRMQQVQYINGILWGSLDTAITIPGDTGERSGVAWFKVRPSLDASGGVIAKAKIADQGYLASQGNYLLYPAIQQSPDGTVAMVMSLTGLGTFPSAVYTVRAATSSGHHDFGALNLIAGGAAANHGFTCSPCRWGDYSAAVFDPSNDNIWMATEYIPGAGDVNANWGTRVAEVKA